MERITSNIFQVGGPGFSHPSDAAVYLITGENEAAIVDAGTGDGTERILLNIERASVRHEDIHYIFITHCHYDHTGGLHNLKEALKAKVVAHTLDAQFIEEGDSNVTAASWYGAFLKPVKVDIKVSEARRIFDVGGRQVVLYHTPGHSPGSVVYLTESDGRKVLFGQDVHGPLNDMLLSNRKDYVQSLKFMRDLNADILCEGHFGIYEGRGEIREFIESFL